MPSSADEAVRISPKPALVRADFTTSLLNWRSSTTMMDMSSLRNDLLVSYGLWLRTTQDFTSPGAKGITLIILQNSSAVISAS